MSLRVVSPLSLPETRGLALSKLLFLFDYGCFSSSRPRHVPGDARRARLATMAMSSAGSTGFAT